MLEYCFTCSSSFRFSLIRTIPFFTRKNFPLAMRLIVFSMNGPVFFRRISIEWVRFFFHSSSNFAATKHTSYDLCHDSYLRFFFLLLSSFYFCSQNNVYAFGKKNIFMKLTHAHTYTYIHTYN